MKNKIIAVIIPVLLLIAVSCDIRVPTEADLPSWFVNLNIPLVNLTQTGKDLISGDSLLTTAPNGNAGDSIFVFQKSYSLDTVKVGNRLRIDDINQTFTQKVDDIIIEGRQKQEQIEFDATTIADISETAGSSVGLIELANTGSRTSPSFTFREIMPADLVQSMESTIQSNGGEATFNSIPERDLDPSEKPFQFDSFQYALLTAGFLDFTLVNNLFLPLGSPIHVSLRYSNGVEFATTTFSNPIDSNSSAMKTIDLSGDSLGSDIIIHVEGHSNGTSNPVTLHSNDLDRDFHFEMQIRDMVATETNARIKSQTLSHQDTLNLLESNNRIETATLNTGTLSLEMTNQMNLPSEVYLRIPSLLDADGSMYERGPIELPAQSTVYREFSLTGTTLQMDTSDQVVHYEYDVQTLDTDSEFKKVTHTDSVGANLSMSNVSVGTLTGVLEQKTTTKEGSISLTSDNEIIRAVVQSGEIVLNFDNQVGGSPHLHLIFHQIYTSPGSNVNLERDVDLSADNNDPVIIPLNNTEIRMPRDDQTVYYTSVTTSGGQYDTYNLDGLLDIAINVSPIQLSETTGYFTQDAMVVVDSIALDNVTKLEEATIDSGQLNLNIQNHVGIAGAVRLQLDEFISNGMPLDTTILIPETNHPVTKTIPLRGYKIEMALDDQSVHYSSRIRLLQNELMTLTFDDSVVVDVNIDQLTFSRVQGEIEPVEVNIDPIEQEFSALPEELNGVEFSHVDMGIDFDTDIGVPVFLNLTVKAYNNQGDSAVSAVEHWDITDSNKVRLPHPEDFINILPNRIVATGHATAGAPGVVGVLKSDQFMVGDLQISVPLQFEITGDAIIEPEAQLVKENALQDIESVVIYTKVNNQFEIGAAIDLYGAKDSTEFHALSSATSLASFQIPASSAMMDTIVLPSDKIDLFADSLYVKPRIQLLPMTDANGSPQTSSVLSTDSLQMTLYAKIRYLNKPGDSGNNN